MRQAIFELLTDSGRSFRIVESNQCKARAKVNAALLVDDKVISCVEILEGERVNLQIVNWDRNEQ